MLYLIGWFGTAALVAALRRDRHPEESRGKAILLGVLAGALWPVSLWIAVGLWWHRRRGTAAAPSRLAEVRAYREQAEIDGMSLSARHWREEETRLAEVRPHRPARIALACAAGFLGTLFVLGGTGDRPPPPAPPAAPALAPVATPAPPGYAGPGTVSPARPPVTEAASIPATRPFGPAPPPTRTRIITPRYEPDDPPESEPPKRRRDGWGGHPCRAGERDGDNDGYCKEGHRG